MEENGGISSLAGPLLRSDLLYHVAVTKLADYLLTLRTIKATRIQLNAIRRRSGTGAVVVDLPRGLRMEFDLSSDLDAFMYDYLSKYGHYEMAVESALSRCLTGETTFLDVGANVGYFTVLGARVAEVVYAFEPVPAVFARLSRNLALNNLKNVKAFECAVSRERSKLRLYESRISAGHDSVVRRFEHDKSIMVDALSLDEVVEPSAKDVVMKVDVEGSEMEVILGAERLLKSGKVSTVIVEWARGLYRRVTDLRERFSLYSSLGDVRVLDDSPGGRTVRDRREIPDYCNLLIDVRR